MRFFWRWPARMVAGSAAITAAAALTAGAASTAPGLAAAGQANGLAARLAAARTAGLAPAGAAVTAARVVTLVTGDRLAIAPAGSSGVLSVTRLGGWSGGGIVGLSLGGARYAVPIDALPYLARGSLDPGLFRLAAVAGSEAGGRVPVVLRASAGPVRPVPGVTVTGRLPGGAVSGFVSAAGARVFGAALARQFAADHAQASYGRDGLFGGGLSVSLPGTAAALARPATAGPAARPAGRGPFRLDTLTIRECVRNFVSGGDRNQCFRRSRG